MSADFSILDCWFLTGPTASGKTSIGIELARRLNAEVLSLDSMAIYRHMDIGTAKPTVAERAGIPHHLLDLVEPEEEFSVARYVELAHEKIVEIRSRGREVLFVGGTPLYLKSLLRGIFEGPQADWEFRRQVEEELRTVGQQALYERLAAVDPLSAKRLHPNDTRRLIRALEVYKLTGQPISHLQLQFEEGTPPEQCRVFVLQREVPELQERINQRVDAMFEQGLVAEVENYLAQGRQYGRTAQQAVGYREVLEALAGRMTLDEAREQVKIRTRRFAKRQRTWFRSLIECRMVPISGNPDPAAVADQIAEQGRELAPRNR